MSYDNDVQERTTGVSRSRFLKHVGAAAATASLAAAIGPDALVRAATTDAPPAAPNRGNPITLTMWTPWPAPEAHYPQFVAWINAYQKAYPNVTIKLEAFPWAQHWTKLQAAAQTGTGPDIDAMHSVYYSQFYDAGLLAPYPESLFPLGQMRNDYILLSQVLAPDGKLYLWPEDAATGMLLYNKDVWQKAGLSDKDAPKTWDDVARLAKELTVRSNGVVKRYGFNWGDAATNAPSWFLLDAYYQQGGYLFSPDGTRAVFNNDKMIQAFQTHKDMVTRYKVSSYAGNAPSQLGTGQNAMMRGWAWMTGVAQQANPKARIGAFPLPNYTGKPGPYGWGVLQVGFGVFSKAPADRQEAAFHFIQWLFRGANRVQRAVEYAALDGGVPPYKPATSKATTVGHEVIAQAAPQAVYLGDFPPDVEAALIKALQQFELAGVQPSVALAQAVRTANRALNLRRLIVTERVRPS